MLQIKYRQRRQTILKETLAKIRQAIAGREADLETLRDILSPEELARLKERLAAILAEGRLMPLERAEAGNALAHLGDPRPEVMSLKQMHLCYIPSGPFMMGSVVDDTSAGDDEKPQHDVTLDYAYWLGRYPVTVAQFKAFVDDSGYQVDDPASLRDPLNRPACSVTWHEALAFCRWLSDLGQVRGWLPAGWQITLPSEAEWEKGAR